MKVSVVTPTYERRKFILNLIEIYKDQTYPKENMEWIIVDDGKDCVNDLFMEASRIIPNIRYVYRDEKLRIGAKRNLLNELAQGDIIISMDDDDYYPPECVEKVVELFEKNPKIELLGASEMLLYYIDTKKVYKIGPYSVNHATNGTMAWRKKYGKTHRYDEYVTKAEEVSFLDSYIHPMIQIHPMYTCLAICHNDNTIDKKDLRKQHEEYLKVNMNEIPRSIMRETEYKLKEIIKNPKINQFYESL